MIKYCELEGYTNLGEVAMFSHLYQFIEIGVDISQIILIHAYDITPAIVFKGYLYEQTQEWKRVELTNDETVKIKKFIGDFKQVDLPISAKKHELLKGLITYKEIKENNQYDI